MLYVYIFNLRGAKKKDVTHVLVHKSVELFRAEKRLMSVGQPESSFLYKTSVLYQVKHEKEIFGCRSNNRIGKIKNLSYKKEYNSQYRAHSFLCILLYIASTADIKKIDKSRKCCFIHRCKWC